MSPFDGAADYADIASLKTPPHSLEAEQAVLGGLLVDPGAWDRLDGIVAAEDFYRPEHRRIFETMTGLGQNGSPIDPITVADALSHAGQLEQAGGFGYIAEMAAKTPGAANVRAYAQAVRERAQLRALISAGTEIADSGYNADGRPASELVDEAQAAIMALGEKLDSDLVTTNQALKAVIDDIDRKFNSESSITGLATGFADIDRRLSGLQPSDFIVIAGRPSMGKTTFAMNIVENVVLAGGTVLVFSLEMSRTQLLERMISSVGKINLGRVRTGKLEADEWPKLSMAVSSLKDRGLIIDDRAALSIQQMRTAARKIHRVTPLSLVVLDYLQQATAKTLRTDGRTEEVSAISRGLKAMAKELNAPVIGLSQLNRDLEKRPVTDRRPRNSDLRDSGAIEQDADLICMLYRDEVYRPNDSDRPGVCEAIWTKFRNGEIGTDFLSSQLQFSRFETLAFDARPSAPQPPMRKRGGFDC